MVLLRFLTQQLSYCEISRLVEFYSNKINISNSQKKSFF